MGTKITDGFDSGDDEKVVSILKKWKGGVLSDSLFTTISLMSPQVGVIIVVFRKIEGRTEIVLLPRPAGDPVWPGMLNLPGKMFRSSDFKREDKMPINGPLSRIQEEELKVNLSDKPKFSGVAYQDTKRGPIVVLVHSLEVPSDFVGNSDWVWRDINDLEKSDDMIRTEMDAIKVVFKGYFDS